MLLTFRVDGALGKPTPAAAELASQRWIADVLDEDTAHEYASAVEAPQEEVEPELLEATPGQGGPLGVAGPEVAALRARLVQLETLLANRDPPAGPVGQPSRLGAMVFGNQPQPGLSPQDVEALKRAVGPPLLGALAETKPLNEALAELLQTTCILPSTTAKWQRPRPSKTWWPLWNLSFHPIRTHSRRCSSFS